ncbi:MAG TPA: PD-(D/E)XK nuclease family protein [Gemmataceae bacterium]|nr:PD-(D/E)XK nuclease family protein [Gemmataceae bacterium]
MSGNTNLAPTFLADLLEIHASLEPQTTALLPKFLSDLAFVYSSLGASPAVDFKFLAARFEAWRQWAQKTMHLHLKDVSPDDPLLCPISLFRTMDYGRLETAHTRTLAWLLDPQAEHGFGETLLASLLHRVTGLDAVFALNVELVASEFQIAGAEEAGRLDVLVEGAWEVDKIPVRWLLAIEAKVDAWESETQLAKYEKWLNLRASEQNVLNVFRVFLTPNGRAAQGGNEDWSALSFLDLVRTFHSTFARLRDAPGFHFLRFYLAGVLQDICGWPRTAIGVSTNPYLVLDYLKSVT